MSGIYYKEGIYVQIENDTKNDICVVNEDKEKALLYGERISIHYFYHSGDAWLNVDGISIIKINNNIVRDLSLSEITSHLNSS